MHRIAYWLARRCELASGRLWDWAGSLSVWAMKRDPKWQENYVKRFDVAERSKTS